MSRQNHKNDAIALYIAVVIAAVLFPVLKRLWLRLKVKSEHGSARA